MLTHKDQFAWDTSPLKIVDNLVIGFLKMVRGEKVGLEGMPQTTRT
jgi:hypothetical protein